LTDPWTPITLPFFFFLQPHSRRFFPLRSTGTSLFFFSFSACRDAAPSPNKSPVTLLLLFPNPQGRFFFDRFPPRQGRPSFLDKPGPSFLPSSPISFFLTSIPDGAPRANLPSFPSLSAPKVDGPQQGSGDVRVTLFPSPTMPRRFFFFFFFFPPLFGIGERVHCAVFFPTCLFSGTLAVCISPFLLRAIPGWSFPPFSFRLCPGERVTTVLFHPSLFFLLCFFLLSFLSVFFFFLFFARLKAGRPPLFLFPPAVLRTTFLFFSLLVQRARTS